MELFNDGRLLSELIALVFKSMSPKLQGLRKKVQSSNVTSIISVRLKNL